MLTPSSSRYKNVLNSPSQAAKIKNLDLFKNKIKEEIKRKNHCKSYLKLDCIKAYNEFSSEFKDFSLDMALLLLEGNADIQTIKERLIELKNKTKGTHSFKLGKKIVCLQEEDIKAFEKRVERYIKYKNMQCQVTYSKIEDSGDLLLHNVENAIYYIYHYFAKALDLQKKDGKKEAEKNKESEAINSCEQTSSDEKKDNVLGNNDLNIKQESLSDNTVDGNILSSIKGIDNSCQDSSINSTGEITLLKEQVNQLINENTQLKNNKNDTKQQLDKDTINTLLKSKNELEYKIAQLQEQLEDKSKLEDQIEDLQKQLNISTTHITNMENAILCVQEKNEHLKKEAEENEAVLAEKSKKIELLEEENILLSDKESKISNEAEEVKRLKSELEKKEEQIKYFQKDIADLAEKNSELVKAKRQLENVRDDSIDNYSRTTQENTQLQDELEDKQQQLKKYESENNELQTKLQEFESKNKELEIEIQENKVQELEELKSTTDNLNAILKNLEGINAQLCKEKEELKQELDDAQQSLTEKINELESIKVQSAELRQSLEVKTNEVIELKGKTNSAKVQLERLQQELTKKTDEFENVSKKLDDANQKISQLEQEYDSTQQHKIQQLEVFEDRDKELKDENKRTSSITAQQTRNRVSYAATSFILSGVCAVGASLTIPYLAACITLAIAASTFLVAGLCYSYKINTALSDVETDQQSELLLESSI